MRAAEEEPFGSRHNQTIPAWGMRLKGVVCVCCVTVCVVLCAVLCCCMCCVSSVLCVLCGVVSCLWCVRWGISLMGRRNPFYVTAEFL